MTFSKRRNKILAILALTVFPVPVLAQETVSPRIFDAFECDFGQVEEAGGTLFHTFSFINGAGSPVRIQRISASCSCVSVSYPQDLIQGGEVGEISVAFNPAGTAGDVLRTVDVYISDSDPAATLIITAKVKPSEYSVEELYPTLLADGIRVTSLSHRFGYIKAGAMAERRIDVINTSGKPVTLEAKAGGRYLTVAAPDHLGKGEASSIILRYTLPDNTDALGSHSDKVTVVINGNTYNRPVETSCIGLGETAGGNGPAPSLQLNTSAIVMRQSLLKKGYSGSFTVKNSGKANLVIYKTDLPEGTESDLPDGSVIKPGASRKVTVRSNKISFRIGFVTNDPSRPYREIPAAGK